MKPTFLKPLLGLLLAVATSAQASPGDNLAIGGTASASGEGFGSKASYPIDGNTDGNYGNNSVWHSPDATDAGWWEVDLGGVKSVGAVKVWLRTDCCTDRNLNLEVSLLDGSHNEIARFRHETNPFAETPSRPWFLVNYETAMAAQYVRIDRTETPNFIQLAEVQVLEAQPAGATIAVSGLANATVAENKSVTFGPITASYSTGGAVTDGSIQWQQNGADVTGATGASLTFGRALMSDNNSSIKVTVTSLGATGTGLAKLTVTPDVEAPTIKSVVGSKSLNTATIVFSEPVTQATAETLANYSIDGGVTVISAVLSSIDTVTLTTSAQVEAKKYEVTVNGVKDTAAAGGNPIAANSKASFSAWRFALGGVLHEFYQFSGTPSLQNLMDDPRFIAGTPDITTLEPYFEYGPNGSNESGSNYGNKLSGWIVPPETGDYVFFTSGDDNINLYLSTDADPANKKLIAREPQWNNARDWVVTSRRDATNPENRSDKFAGTEWDGGQGAPITLTAGQKYYIEALHQEGGGGDSVGVTWRLPSATEDPANGSLPISGDFVGVFINPDTLKLNILAQPASATVDELGTVSFSVSAEASASLRYQWQKAAAGTEAYADIAGAKNPSLTLANVPLSDNGTKYRVLVKTLGLDATSGSATLTVTADKTAPALACLNVGGGLSTMFVSFNERVTQASAENIANYTLDGGATVQGAILSSSGNKVVLTTSPLTADKLYSLKVSNVKDLSAAGNLIAANSTAAAVAAGVSYSESILADGPIVYYAFNEAAGDTTVVNLGSLGEAANGTFSGTDTGTLGAEGPRPPEFVGFGSNNGAPNFNGTDTSIDTNGKWLDGLGAFSLEYWVKPTAFTGNRVGIVGQNDAIEYGFISPNTIQIWTPNGGSLDTPYNFERDTWHHVASIGTGKQLQTYFDGELINTTSATTANYGASAFNVKIGGGGVFDGTGNWFTGLIDEVAIFNKAMTAEQVRGHYLAAKEGPNAVLKIVSIVANGNNVTINWVCLGTLQKAPSVNGPWSDIAGATSSPYVGTASDAAAFYRLRN